MYGFVHVVLIAPLWLLTIFNFCELTRGVILGCAFIQQHLSVYISYDAVIPWVDHSMDDYL